MGCSSNVHISNSSTQTPLQTLTVLPTDLLFNNQCYTYLNTKLIITLFVY